MKLVCSTCGWHRHWPTSNPENLCKRCKGILARRMVKEAATISDRMQTQITTVIKRKRRKRSIIELCTDCVGHESTDRGIPSPLTELLDLLYDVSEDLHAYAFDDTTEFQSKSLLLARKHLLAAREHIKVTL